MNNIDIAAGKVVHIFGKVFLLLVLLLTLMAMGIFGRLDFGSNLVLSLYGMSFGLIFYIPYLIYKFIYERGASVANSKIKWDFVGGGVGRGFVFECLIYLLIPIIVFTNT
jgi:hypothetical protein